MAYRLMPREKLVSLEVEQLEERDCPSISIQLDYSHDTSGFFTSHPDRESVLFGRVGERMERLRRAFSANEAEEEFAGEPERRGSRELMHARRNLKLALAGRWDSSPEEQRRVAEILRRATDEILGKEPRD